MKMRHAGKFTRGAHVSSHVCFQLGSQDICLFCLFKDTCSTLHSPLAKIVYKKHFQPEQCLAAEFSHHIKARPRSKHHRLSSSASNAWAQCLWDKRSYTTDDESSATHPRGGVSVTLHAHQNERKTSPAELTPLPVLQAHAWAGKAQHDNTE